MKNKNFSMKLLSVVLALALIIGAAPVVFSAEEKSDELLLATVSDLHFYPSTLAGSKGEAYYNYLEGSVAQPDDCEAILDSALESLKNQQKENGLKYVVISGDLTVNGEYEGNRVLSEKLKAFEEETGLTVFVTNGNHDINNSNAAEFTTNRKKAARVTSPEEFYGFYKELGYDDAYHQFKDFADGTQGSLSYSVKLEEGYRLIFADAGKYTPDVTEKGIAEHETSGAISPEQLSWILYEINDAKEDGEVPLLFSHWNFDGINRFHEYLLQGFVIDDAYKLQETLADAGCHYVFSGHQHQSDIAVSYSDSGEPLYSVITPTLTQFPFAYRTTLFRPLADGTVEADFRQIECDDAAAVKSVSGKTYPTPYSETGFAKQMGNCDAADFLMRFVKGMLGDYFMGMRAEGSIVKFIEKKADLDIEKLVNNYLLGGIRYGNSNILTGANVMGFLDDLDVQLMEKYIYDLPYTYSLLEEAVEKICAVQISDVPCTKYIETYGFGDPSNGGTIGDLLLDVFATMYPGNENTSDDAFIADLLSSLSTDSSFVDVIFDTVKKYVVEDLVVDEIFANTDLHINSLFVDHALSIAEYIQLTYSVILYVFDSGFLTAVTAEEFQAALGKLLNFDLGVSLKKLVTSVLDTGFVSYGRTVDELADGLLDQFFGEAEKNAAAYQLYVLLDGIVNDDTQDYDVTYSDAAVAVTPTKEDMQLPSNVQIALNKNTGTSFDVTWFTKYSVTGTDIEIVKAGEAFTGKPTTAGVYPSSSKETFTGYGFDFGSFGILPWSIDVIRHTVTVTGLEEGTAYNFRIGDAARGFMTDGSVTTAPAAGQAFTFINITDTDGTTPSDYENMERTLTAAENTFENIAFGIHSGNIVKEPVNDLQWTWALDQSAEPLSRMPFMYAAGSNDSDESYSVVKHFTQPSVEGEFEECGVYYSYDYANAHFTFLNTNYLNDQGTFGVDEINWVVGDLMNSDADWKIIVMHEPVIGVVGCNEALRSQITYLMNEYKVDLVLQGSEKAYIRTEPVKSEKAVINPASKIVEIDGTQYTTALVSGSYIGAVSGTAGSYFADTSSENHLLAVSRVIDRPVFTAITIEDDALYFGAYAVNEDGSTERIDEFGIDKEMYELYYGDYNFNGVIEPADARLALRTAVRLELPTKKMRMIGDVNKDGSYTTADARIILRCAVGLQKIDPAYIRVSESDLR